MSGQLTLAPGDLYGTEYFVDGTNGLDTNTGLDWAHAFQTIAAAVTASNTYRAITANASKRNRIYVGGQSFSTTIVELPSRTDIFGIGTAHMAVWTIPDSARAAGTHIHNMYFSKAGSTSIFSAVSCSSLEIDNCQFYASTSNSIGIELSSCAKSHIHDTTFFGNLNYAYGIKYSAGSCYGCRIYGNRIFAKTIGIWVENAVHMMTGVIHHNYIANNDANYGGQCTIGIDCNGAYPPHCLYCHTRGNPARQELQIQSRCISARKQHSEIPLYLLQPLMRQLPLRPPKRL